MKVKGLSVFLGVSLVTTVMVLSGCATRSANLVKAGKVKLELVPSSGNYVSRVEVKQDGDELVITGTVKRRNFSGIGGGHVDVSLISPEGEILEQVSTYYTPRIISRKRGSSRHRGSHFEVRLPTVPSAGSKICVGYHRSLESGTPAYHCGKNVALPDT
jgi:hypothetical protein